MDSIEALGKVYESLSKGPEILDFSESGITGECAQQVQEIVRQRKSGKVTKEALGNLLSCLESGNGLGTLGLICSGLSYWKLSVKAYEKSITVFEKTEDVHGEAQTYNNLGLVYAYMGELDKAIEYYQKSLENKEKIGDVRGAAQTYNNLGLVYAYRGKWKKAIEYYKKSLETFEEIGDVHSAAQTYGNLGSVYLNIGEWDKAIEYYKKDLEISEKIGDVHGKGITLLNMGRLHLDKEPAEPEAARDYLENSIKFLNKESRPDYPNALNWLASCYHMIGNSRKAEAKRKKDANEKEKLVNLTSDIFSNASERYAELSGLPKVNIPSLEVYTHLDKGLSYSVLSITEKDNKKALQLLDDALGEFKKALKKADETEKKRINGIIHDHEAKKYIRLALSEEKHTKQDKNLAKAIESLEKATSLFKESGDGEQCDYKTCEGCMHLFTGLQKFREGIKEYTKSGINIQFSKSVVELKEAQKCYEGAVNELGTDTVGSLKESFEYVERLLKSKDETLVMKATDEFMKIIDELSSVGLQKIVKLYTFDESMNVSSMKSESRGAVQINEMHAPVILGNQEKSGNGMSIADAATLAGFFGLTFAVGWIIYQKRSVPDDNIAVVIAWVIFLVLLIVKKFKKPL